MGNQLFISLVYNTSLLLVLVAVYSGIKFKIPFGSALPSGRRDILTGVLIGLIGVAVMDNPWTIHPGIFFDARSILLGVAGLFFGFVPTALAVVITGAYRLSVHGPGTLPGLGVILTSAGLGLIWRHFRPGLPQKGGLAELYLFGLSVHFLQLACFLLLPWPMAAEVLGKVGLPVITIFPVGTVLLSVLLIHQRNREKIEEKLRESEQLFRNIFEKHSAVKFLLDPETGDIVDANAAAASFYGWPREKLRSMNIREINTLAPDEIKKRLKQAADGNLLSFEFRHRRADGSARDVEVFSGSIVSEGRVLIHSIVHDITERKEAERKLRESEDRYRMLFEQARDSILLLELPPEGEPIILEANAAALLMHGYTREELVGKPISFLDNDPSASSALELVGRIKAAGSLAFEAQHRRKDGSVVDLEVSVKEMAGGGKHLLLDISRDITGRKRAEEALRASEAELRTMAEAMPQIVWIARPDGWNTFINRKWMDYTGLTLEESLGHGWDKPFHPDDQLRAREAWQKARSEKGIYSIESRLRRADGVYRWWLIRGVPLTDAEGKILRWYGTCTDIQDLKMEEKAREEMHSQLLQSQKMEAVGMLAGGVAHDFNNILTAIKAYGGFIYKNLRPEDPMRSDAEEILTASDRAAALTRQLLAFSRRQVLSPQAVDLNKIVGGMTKMLKRLLHEDIALVPKLAEAACSVMADPGQIEQVIMNLVVNARDAMPKGGTLNLQTDIVDGPEMLAAHPGMPRGPLVRLRVRDNGSGMSAEVKSHVFEPFYTTKGHGRGTGLGLSTVFWIIKQSRGEISVETEEGKGTEFSVYLPLLTEAAPEIAVSKPSPSAVKNTETVLLVEDEETLRRLCERLLKEGGYAVISASSGKNALEAMERHGKPADLLLSDVVMPGMSGRDLARELERRKLIRRTLYMSGYTDETIVKHGVLEPGIAFIYKPFSPEGLAAKLREVLDGPAGQAKA